MRLFSCSMRVWSCNPHLLLALITQFAQDMSTRI